MSLLLDVNALIALAWPNHVHHEAVGAWFAARRKSGWATCVFTEAGFVRVSCNPTAVKQVVAPVDAIELLRRLHSVESHAFWAMEHSVVEMPDGIRVRLQGYRQITDAVLLALAVRHNGKLATLDGGLVSLVSAKERAFVELIPA